MLFKSEIQEYSFYWTKAGSKSKLEKKEEEENWKLVELRTQDSIWFHKQ